MTEIMFHTDLEPLSALAAGGRQPVLPQDLWPGIIGPPGITNWAGPGAAGKGLAWAKVAADISQGWPMPPTLNNDPLIDWDTVPTPGNVIVVSPEDAPEVVYHRVRAAGGDMDRIYNLSTVEVTQADEMARMTFSMPRDFGYLRAKIAEIGDVRLVVLDNLMALATSTVSFNQQYRMNIGNPLEEIGRDLGVRFLLVNHFTKGLPKGGLSSNRNLGDYIFGSAGVIQAARLTAVFLPQPENPEVISITTYKTNGARAPRPVRYTVEGKGENVRLLWEQPPLSAANPAQMDRLVESIVRALDGGTRGVTEQELAAWLHIPHPMIRHALMVAEDQGMLETRRGAWAVPGLFPPLEIEAPVDEDVLDVEEEPQLGELMPAEEYAMATSREARDAEADRILASYTQQGA